MFPRSLTVFALAITIGCIPEHSIATDTHTKSTLYFAPFDAAQLRTDRFDKQRLPLGRPTLDERIIGRLRHVRGELDATSRQLTDVRSKTQRVVTWSRRRNSAVRSIETLRDISRSLDRLISESQRTLKSISSAELRQFRRNPPTLKRSGPELRQITGSARSAQENIRAVESLLQSLAVIREDVRNRRQQEKAAFANADRKARQLYDILRRVLEAMMEMRQAALSNIQ